MNESDAMQKMNSELIENQLTFIDKLNKILQIDEDDWRAKVKVRK